MPGERLTLAPGSLWGRVQESTERALGCGALQPLPSDCEFVEQGGINFIVRILANLSRKKAAPSGPAVNPFLPYDRDLFVADLSDTHVCLLNKFNVVDYHLLMVTREFEDQENLLNLKDFIALGACMAEIEGLAFYNAGKVAGASQQHKHLQLIPLPLAPQGPEIPIEPALQAAQWQGRIGVTPKFPFVHAIARPELQGADSRLDAAKAMFDCYHALVRATSLEERTLNGENRQIVPYNLLATRRWMLLVPRAQECFQSISVNALGFVGALLVRNRQELQIVKEHGPMTILGGVTHRRDFDNGPL